MRRVDTSSLICRTAPLPRILKDMPGQQLLKVASPADIQEVAKRISPVALPGMSFPIRKKHAYLFVITTGASESWSANENADYNIENDGKIVTALHPCDKKVATLKMGKGLRNTHSTFKIHGAVYRNHKTEPEHKVPRSGEIVWERYNDAMHRGELIIELPEDKWSTELSLYDKDTPLMWSQGNGVPWDACSRCLFIFKPKMKPEDRCDCIRKNKLCFDEDGRQIVIYCADCLFYDISYVGNNPASKIAAALLRVAGSEDVQKTYTFGAPRINHYSASAVTRALLDAEKSITPEEVAGVKICCSPDPTVDSNFAKDAKETDSLKLIAALHHLAIVLTPMQFYRIFVPSDGEPVGVSGFLDALPGVFGRAVEQDPAMAKDTGYCPAEPPDPATIRRFEKYVPDLGVHPVTTRKILIIKSAASQNHHRLNPSKAGMKLADEYARYLHTCLTSFAGPLAARRYVGTTQAGL